MNLFRPAATRLVLAALVLAFLVLAAPAWALGPPRTRPAAEPPAYGTRDDVMRFADELAARQPTLDAAWVRTQLERARFVAPATRLIMPRPTGTAKSWAA